VNTGRDPSNAEIAAIFHEVADLLEAQGASPFRVRAWRSGAAAVRADASSIADAFREGGWQALTAIPHIGRGLASVIVEILKTGRPRVLERLQGEVGAEAMFARLPGVGEELAGRIHRELGIETLEELERAAHDGRLRRVAGFGEKRVRSIRDVLAARLGRPAFAIPTAPRPPVGLLLEADRSYREGAAAGTLRRIAPRRFNPTGEAWLPVLHLESDGWDLTLLYSNTAQAHQLGMTRDWVVIYHARDGHEGRSTVVTERRGPLAGLRVVRGRETECARHHAGQATPLAGPAL
jgi:hypothetical protein